MRLTIHTIHLGSESFPSPNTNLAVTTAQVYLGEPAKNRTYLQAGNLYLTVILAILSI